ncbi:hypothetical protein K523DRAFT_320384 [Schizophyllum commune Tattone D]|nr:hypothetical protein K523DRAFT_320384 [Schizophyllum commune Tattone D]
MRTFSLAHVQPCARPAAAASRTTRRGCLPPSSLEDWWVGRTPALWIHVTTYCTAKVELPAVNGLTFVWVGDGGAFRG